MLKINDLFWTVQGEGTNWGRRALFVRMPFCNLACSWCDTSFNSFKKISEQEFADFAQQEPGRFAVITGGEPMMNLQTPRVVEILRSLGFEVACESNGTFPIVHGIDFVTVSPKSDSDYYIHWDALSRINDLKLIVDEGFDFEVAKRIEKDLAHTTAKLWLSPEFGTFKQSIEKILEFIKENPQWRINLQTHKWMQIP